MRNLIQIVENAQAIITEHRATLESLAAKYPDYQDFVNSLDAVAFSEDILFRGKYGDPIDNNSFMTDYVGHAREYAGDDGVVEAFLYNPQDVLFFRDDQFDEMRRAYRDLDGKGLAELYRSALAGHRHAEEFAGSLRLVRTILRRDTPYTSFCGDPSKNDPLVPLMQKFAREKHGKNIIAFTGSDYDGDQIEFVVGDVSKLQDLRKLHAAAQR